MGSSGTRVLVADLVATAPAWRMPPGHEEQLTTRVPAGWSVKMIQAPTVSDGDGGTAPSAEVVEAIRDAEVYLGFGLSRDLFNAGTRLRWVHSAAAGVASALFPEMLRSDAVLTNSAGIHAVPMAEYVVGGVLYFARGLDIALEAKRDLRWERQAFIGPDSPIREVGGSRVLIIGTGGIGTEVARRLRSLGAECVGIRRRTGLGAPDGFASVSDSSSLENELRRADVVVLTAPATPETIGLLSRERLALLPKHAVLVNVSRGSLVDEEALADRLESGLLRGAVLDVTLREPPPLESRLWRLPTVLLSPHVAAVSPRRFWEREMALILENWERYRRGEPLRNVVDKEAGY